MDFRKRNRSQKLSLFKKLNQDLEKRKNEAKKNLINQPNNNAMQVDDQDQQTSSNNSSFLQSDSPKENNESSFLDDSSSSSSEGENDDNNNSSISSITLSDQENEDIFEADKKRLSFHEGCQHSPKIHSSQVLSHPAPESVISNSFYEHYQFDYDELIQSEYNIQMFDPLAFMSNVQDLRKVFVPPHPLLPPFVEKTGRKSDLTLVLDLDETLVHCSTEKLSGYSTSFQFPFHDTTLTIHMKQRPFLPEFLKIAKEMFQEIILFTASMQAYADCVLAEIDPDRSVFDYALYRESCVVVEDSVTSASQSAMTQKSAGGAHFLKDLSLLGRDLSKLVIIDNSLECYAFQPKNGLPIMSYFDDDTDTELTQIIPFLEVLCNVQKSGGHDVRDLLEKKFGLGKRIESHLSVDDARLINVTK